MASARIRTTDVVASIEKYLDDNWPDSAVTWQPTAHAAFDGATVEGDHWAALQWLDVDQTLMRAAEDRQDFGFRVLCWSRGADRLRATRAADAFAVLLDDSTVDLISRSDGTTVLGEIIFHTITVAPPEMDPRGVRLSVLSGNARAYLS